MQDEVVKRLLDRQAAIKNALVEYPVDSLDKYQRLCGEYAGIAFALQAIFSAQGEDNGDI